MLPAGHKAQVVRLPVDAGAARGGMVPAVLQFGLCAEAFALAPGKRFGYDVNDATHGFGAVNGRAGSVNDLDALDLGHGHGHVPVEVAGERIIDAHAVDQDEHLVESASAHGNVGLRAEQAAALDFDAGQVAQQVVERGGRDAVQCSALEYGDVLAHLAGLHIQSRSSDDHRIELVLCLRDQGKAHGYNQDEERDPLCFHGFVLNVIRRDVAEQRPISDAYSSVGFGRAKKFSLLFPIVRKMSAASPIGASGCRFFKACTRAWAW